MRLDTLEVIPLISRVRERAMMIQEEVVCQIEYKLPNLAEHDLNVIRKYSKSIVNQILMNY